MIKTLKAANGTYAQLGSPQVDPVTDDPAYRVKRATHVVGSNSASPIPAHEAGIDTPTLTYDEDGELHVDSNASAGDMARSLVENERFLLPPYHSKTNQVLPSFAQNLEPVEPTNKEHVKNQADNSKEHEPYEKKTGISHERPEIVMLTNFLPLFTKDVSHSHPSSIHHVENSGIHPFMTDAGRFVDTHLHSRNLRFVNMVHLLRVLHLRYAHLHSHFSQRRRRFERRIDALRDDANFLLDLIKTLERLKSQLDLQDDIHVVETQTVLREYLVTVKSQLDSIASGLSDTFESIGVDTTANVPAYDLVKNYLPATYSVPDVLIRLGYTRDNVKQKFASTKLWLQMLVEMRDILKFHSHEFIDIDPVAQKHDSSASKLTKDKAKLFGLTSNFANLLTLNDLAVVQPSQLRVTATNVAQAWKIIYNDVHFRTDEAHIAALVNLVSKEFRFSTGLAQPDVQKMLANRFGYTVKPTANTGLFEAIIGEFGNNISDFPAADGKSMADVAQHQGDNVTVLNFESKYVDGDTGKLVPGGTHYVDHVLKTDGKTFSTGRINDLGIRFENAYSRFAAAVTGLNLLALKTEDPLNAEFSQFSSTLSSPVEFTATIVDALVNRDTGVTQPKAVYDNLGGVYAYAAKSPAVKAILFMFTFARLSRAYMPTLPFFDGGVSTASVDNTPTSDALILLLIRQLEKEVPQTLTGNLVVDDINRIDHDGYPLAGYISGDGLQSSLKTGTALTRLVEATMQRVLSAFVFNNQAITNNRTRYSGHIDTIVMMSIFDAVIQMIAKYCNQKIVGSNFGITSNQGTVYFGVVRTLVNHKASTNDLLTRLEKEVALTHKIVYTVLNTLKKLGGAFKNCSNFLTSATSLDKLQDIAKIIDDPEHLQMLMTEQQIMLLASTVHDLMGRVSQPGAIPDTGDIDKDGDFDAHDEIKILDDSVPLPRLRKAVYGTFGTRHFASRQGYNKKILTVGLPLGFSSKLKQRVNVRSKQKSSFVDKQNDIVQIVVYKVDLVNSDIVYKPKKFLFELSRFPVRNDHHFLPLPDEPELDDIIAALPTRDFGQSFDSGNGVDYYVKPGAGSTDDRRRAFADETYSFLSHHQKAELARNHVLSYMLETYVRLLTGVSLADYHFDLVEPARPMDKGTVKLITEHHVAHFSENVSVASKSAAENQPPAGGVLFTNTAPTKQGYVSHGETVAHKGNVQPDLANPAGIAGKVATHAQLNAINSPTLPPLSTEQQKVIGNMEKNLSRVTGRHIPALLHGFRTISNLSHSVTPISDPAAVSKRILMPKQFDRVFNVVVEPDDFQIDYEKTVKTPHGKQALDQLITTGDVVLMDENDKAQSYLETGDFAVPSGARPFIQGRTAPNVHSYRYRDRNKLAGDLTFEKYFVVVHTFGEDEV